MMFLVVFIVTVVVLRLGLFTPPIQPFHALQQLPQLALYEAITVSDVPEGILGKILELPAATFPLALT